MSVGLVHVVLEVVLGVAGGGNFFDPRGLFDFLDSSGLFSRDRSPFLFATTFFLEVALLATVVVGDVYLVPNAGLFACPLRLGGVDIHWA